MARQGASGKWCRFNSEQFEREASDVFDAQGFTTQAQWDTFVANLTSAQCVTAMKALLRCLKFSDTPLG